MTKRRRMTRRLCRGACSGIGSVLSGLMIFTTGSRAKSAAIAGIGSWSRDARINRLSLARLYLFVARDVWFVVGIPVYFQAVLSDGTPDGRL